MLSNCSVMELNFWGGLERESQFRHASETESVWCFVGH